MEIRCLMKIERITREAKIKNEVMRKQLNIKPVIEMIQEKHVSHVFNILDGKLTRKMYKTKIQEKKQGQIQKKWTDEVNQPEKQE